MTIEKNINGYYVITDIINRRLIKKVYGGYTKREAIRLFKHEIKMLTSRQ